jgi:CheY-like chemotaxis protein
VETNKDVRMAGTGLRVVVVDNDPAALELVVTDLRLEGHEIVAACLDGTSAIDACASLRPDVVVLDHRMPPGPHGLEVARRLADDAPDLRVIVFTNYQDPALIEQIRATGATYLPKGNIRSLRRAVADAVRPR